MKERCKLHFTDKNFKTRKSVAKDVWFVRTRYYSPYTEEQSGKKVFLANGLMPKERCSVTGVAPGSFLVLYTTGLSLWILCKVTNLENIF